MPTLFFVRFLTQGLLRQHGNGIGFDLGVNCEALDRQGTVQPALRVIGPPSAGAFGDPLGAGFIAAQVRRVLPDVVKTLEVQGGAPQSGPAARQQKRDGWAGPHDPRLSFVRHGLRIQCRAPDRLKGSTWRSIGISPERRGLCDRDYGRMQPPFSGVIHG